jgi:hypothetical protein
MPANNRNIRTSVRYGSSALALAGWGGMAWSYLDHGFRAGIHPGFITAATVAAAFTMVAGQWWQLPNRSEREEQAAVFAMGFQEGLGCGACPLRPAPAGGDEPARHLGLVRS